MESNENIRNAIDNGYDFKIGEYISRGFELFKKNPGEYVGYTALYFIISMFISFIPFIGLLIGVVVNPSLQVGILLSAHLAGKSGKMEFGNFFKGFDFLAQLVVANILITILYVILAIPLFIVLGFSLISALVSGDAGEFMNSAGIIADAGLWFLVFFLMMVYVNISLRWTNYLIVFHKYEAVEAIKSSWLLTNKKWFYHLAFVLVCGLIIIGGFLGLVVGILFAYPLIMLADYEAYADVTKLNISEEAIDEIGDLQNPY